MLTLHASGFVPYPQKIGLVGRHHAAGVTKMVQDIPAQVIAYRVGVPGVEIRQTLHPVRGRVPGRRRSEWIIDYIVGVTTRAPPGSSHPKLIARCQSSWLRHTNQGHTLWPPC